MNVLDHDRLRLRLGAEGRPHLLPLFEEVPPTVLGERFELTALAGLGRQRFVFQAVDRRDGATVAVKTVAWDLADPLALSRAEIARHRQGLGVQFEVLQACRTGHLPAPVAFLRTSSPFPALRDHPVLGRDEPFLVEEYVGGPTLTALALGPWRVLPPDEREDRVRRAGAAFLHFWRGLLEAGWVYCDVSPDNLVGAGANETIRVVDAGSVTPAGPQVRLVGFTPAFLTPLLLARATAGEAVPGSLVTMLPMLAKTLHFLFTLRQPLNGRFPEDWTSLDGVQFSPRGRAALEAMLALDGTPDPLPDVPGTVFEWLESPPPLA